MRLARLLPALAGLALLGAAAPPRALAGVEPGLWEVSRSASGHQSRRICLREVIELASYAHAGERCGRTILVDRPGLLEVDLSCPRGELARSRISVTTPRALKLETQGIHRSLPFAEVLYARRIGPCPSADARR